MSPASAAPRSAPTPPQLRNPLRSALTKAPIHPAHLPRPHPRSTTRDGSVVVGRQTHIVREISSPPGDRKGCANDDDDDDDDGKEAAGAGARHFVVDATSSPPTPPVTDSQQAASWGLPPQVYTLDDFSAPRQQRPAKLAQQQPAGPRHPSSHLPATSLTSSSILSHIHPPTADDAASTTRQSSSSGTQPTSLHDASQQQAARRRTASLTALPLSSPPALPTLLEEGEEGDLSPL